MKKIGIVSVTYIDNFGSHLQTFALQEVIKKLGYETEIIRIDSAKKEIDKNRKKYVISRILHLDEMMAYFPYIKNKIALKLDSNYRKIVLSRSIQYNDFAKKYYIFSEKVEGFTGLRKLCLDNYDTVIVGSDQNWRPANIAGGYYTLEFVPDEINKVAYATSFGLNHIVNSQKNKSSFFLKRIKHLSVREQSGKEIIKELLERTIPVVSDPTLLLTSDKWNKYLSDRKIINGDYILCYFLGANPLHWKFVERLKSKTGLKIVGLPYGEIYSKNAVSFLDEIPLEIGPLDFISLIKDATYVCTDSFHCCAFSINYNKIFFAFYKHIQKNNMSTNGRIDNLLDIAGLKNRIITGGESIEDWMLQPINYSDINKKISDFRDMSLKYLSDSILDKNNTDIGEI